MPAPVPFPRPTSRLVGRSAELRDVVERLRDGARCVTLTGLGGMGKTRLAIEVCVALEDVRVSAYCHAAPCASLAVLALAVAQALGVELAADGVRDGDLDALARVTAKLPPHLIVLDDFENLSDSAGRAVERWLFRSPTTALLVTSRRTIGCASEHVVAVEPLACATADDAGPTLLRERARQLRPTWGEDDAAAVVRLAARLDGLPLAIELVAAQARSGGPRELELLWSARHETAGEIAVAWSWEHLTDDARRDLSALATIVGPFDLELAAAAFDDDIGGAVARIADLVHESLVVPASAAPYRLLDTVRDFVVARAEPMVLERAKTMLVRRVLARTLPLGERRVPVPAPLCARVAGDQHVLVDVVRQGLAGQRLDDAFAAATVLISAFRIGCVRVVSFEELARLCLVPAVSAVSIAARLALGASILALLECVPEPLTEPFTRVFERWLDEVADPSARFHARLQLAKSLSSTWRYAELGEVLATLGDPPNDELRLRYHVTFLRLFAAQKLGRLTSDMPELAALDRIALELEAAGRIELGSALTNQCFFHVQLARPDAIAFVSERVARVARLGVVNDRYYLERERARAEIDGGALARGLARLGAICERGLALARDTVETRLEVAAAQLEAWEVEAAANTLAELRDQLGSPYAAAYHAALSQAVAALTGGVASTWRPTRTTEDVGFAIWGSLGTDRLAAACASTGHIASMSSRVRQALRVGRTLLAARAGEGLMVTLDGSAFRTSLAWVDLQGRAVMRALLGALVAAARVDRHKRLDKDELGARLWPGERLASTARDNRLHVTIASLRKLGLGELLVHGDGGFGIDPRVPFVRINRS